MKFLADRIKQLETGSGNGQSGAHHPKRGSHPQNQGDPVTDEIQILRAAKALIEAEMEWLLQKLKSDLEFVRTELGQDSVAEVGRCAARVATFMNSPKDFESSEFASILECADRIFAGLDFEPSRKYSQAFRALRCRVLDEFRQICARQNLKFSFET
jgi:hypothetical protein